MKTQNEGRNIARRILTEHTVSMTIFQYNGLLAKERKSEAGSHYIWQENQWKQVTFISMATKVE